MTPRGRQPTEQRTLFSNSTRGTIEIPFFPRTEALPPAPRLFPKAELREPPPPRRAAAAAAPPASGPRRRGGPAGERAPGRGPRRARATCPGPDGRRPDALGARLRRARAPAPPQPGPRGRVGAVHQGPSLWHRERGQPVLLAVGRVPVAVVAPRRRRRRVGGRHHARRASVPRPAREGLPAAADCHCAGASGRIWGVGGRWRRAYHMVPNRPPQAPVP